MSKPTKKVALVTGAASGIGKACADRLERENFVVVRCDLRPDDAGMISLDVRIGQQWQDAVAQVIADNGRLDVLINAAGVSLDEDTVEACDPAIWSAVFETNVSGPFLGTKHVIPAMRRQGEGVILNIGSILANVGDGQAAAYSASKGALKQLTKSVALHLARSNLAIRCNLISPGYIQTPLLDRWAQSADADLAPYIRNTPLGRLGKAEEVASLAAYLCSDGAAAATGTEFIVDGGYTAR